MEFSPNRILRVDKALEEPNPVLFCSEDGSPITFHVEAGAGEDEKDIVVAVRIVASAFGGKYIDEYAEMTPYTALLVTDEGFKKRKYSRPAVCVTYVGDCIDCNSLLDMNEYLHPWEDKEKWKNLNLNDVFYFFKEKFPVIGSPRKRKSQDGGGSAPTTPLSTTSLLSPMFSYDPSLESPAQKKRHVNPVSGEDSNMVLGLIRSPRLPEKVTPTDTSDALIAADHAETPKSKESNDKLPENDTDAVSDVMDADVVLKCPKPKESDNTLPKKKTGTADEVTVRQSIIADCHRETLKSSKSDSGSKSKHTDQRKPGMNKKRAPSPEDKISSVGSKSKHTDQRKPGKNKKKAPSPEDKISSVNAQSASGPSKRVRNTVSRRGPSSSPSSSRPKPTPDNRPRDASSSDEDETPLVSLCSSDEDETPLEPRRRGRGAQDRYRTWEQNTLVRYLVENNKFRNLKGTTVWKDMEKKKILRNRPWQSLKNQFLKNILKNLDNFSFLTQEEKSKFISPPVESSDDDDSTFFYAGDFNKARRPATKRIDPTYDF